MLTRHRTSTRTATLFPASMLFRSRGLAEEGGGGVEFREVVLTAWDWPEETFDAVVAIFIQFVGPAFRREMFDGFRQALKPGGILLLHGYREEQLDYATGGPSTVENLYTEQSLLEDRKSTRLNSSH